MVVSGLEYLLARDLEDFEKDLDQAWSIEVMKVLLAEICFVSRLHPCNYDALANFNCVFDQAAERTF